MKFSIKDYFSTSSVTFTEEIFNGKPHFLCSVVPEVLNVKEKAHFMDY